MSSAAEGEEEDENNNNSSVGEAKSSPTMMSRRLQTFGSPDLAVTVGIDEHLYNYHSFILASQSLYVDTLLSSPAARTEQERGRISFPDITVETWEKMMMYLLPTNKEPSTSDLKEIVPFYDKYQFLDGLAYCDEMIKSWLVQEIINGTIIFRMLHEEHEKNMAWLTRYIYDLPDFFPKSRPIAIKWGKEECLSQLRWGDEDTVKILLPLIENDNETTKAMVSTYLGRKCVGMTMNEMRDLVKQPDFPEQCIFRNEQIKQLDEQREQLRVNNLRLSFGGEAVDGGYVCHDHYRHVLATHKCGAMRCVWVKKNNPSLLVKLGALNFYGSVWEVYSTEIDDNGEIEGSKKVLYRWESDIFSSLVPPKIGWEEIDDDGNCVKSKICLDYSYDSKRF